MKCSVSSMNVVHCTHLWCSSTNMLTLICLSQKPEKCTTSVTFVVIGENGLLAVQPVFMGCLKKSLRIHGQRRKWAAYHMSALWIDRGNNNAPYRDFEIPAQIIGKEETSRCCFEGTVEARCSLLQLITTLDDTVKSSWVFSLVKPLDLETRWLLDALTSTKQVFYTANP